MGRALGPLLAVLGTRGLLSSVPDGLPRMEDIGVGTAVLIFALMASPLTGVFFGLAPAGKCPFVDLHSTPKEDGRSLTGGRHRLRDLFIMLEVSAALVLLAGAGVDAANHLAAD